MRSDFLAGLLPVLGTPSELGFNVFDVMHHGLHEKQISNVFRWLLDAGGTHRMGDKFTRIFMDEVNRARPSEDPFSLDGYWVRQEVNTSGPTDPGDIADLVLESRTSVVVIENFVTSDGHGHDYDRYLAYSQRKGGRGVVVLLCRDEDRSLQTNGWQHACVVTYATLITRLREELASDGRWGRDNPEAYTFIEQLYRKFVRGRGPVQDGEVLDFVVAMCQTGEARRYQISSKAVAAEQFASDVAEQARERFGEGRELLQRVRTKVRNYGADVLAPQLNATLGEGTITKVGAAFRGIYQWTVNFDLGSESGEFGEPPLQIKFGPSAWFAIEEDPNWQHTVDPDVADYSRLFLTRSAQREIRQSSVTLQEVLDGLEPTDRRLHDEILQLIRPPATAPEGGAFS